MSGTNSTWNTASSGDWSDTADWTGVVPDSGVANATIAQAGTYTVDIGSGESFTADTIILDDAAATLQIAGTLNLARTLRLTAGTLDLSGTISGGTIVAGIDAPDFTGGTLSGVKYEGSLNLSAASSENLYVTNGLTLTGAGGNGAGAVNLTGTSCALYFLDNNEVLNSATVTFGGSGDQIYAYYSLTLGATLAIAQSAAGSSDGLDGATIIGEGSITLTAKGGNFTVDADSFTNNGTISVSNGDTLTFEGPSFANAGKLSANRATIDFNGAWTNTGTVDVANSAVNFSAAVATAEFDLFDGDKDTITIGGGGTLENAGATLTVGNGSGFSPITLAGTISGGTIVDNGSGFDFAGGTLSGVTYQGPLDLSGTSANVYVTNGLTLTGTGGGAVNLTGTTCGLYFLDSETFNDATVTFSGSGNQIYAYYSLTLGSGLSIVQSAAGSNDNLDGATIVNDGTIDLNASGGDFFIASNRFTNDGLISVSNGEVLDLETSFANMGVLSSNDGTIDFNGAWTNPGTVHVTNSNVNFLSGETGSVTTAEFELFAGANDSMDIGAGGVLDNSGATLTVGTGSGFSLIYLEGDIDGGTIVDGGSGIAFNGGELSGVTYEGALDLSGAANVSIDNGINLTGAGGNGPGMVNLTGTGGALYFLDSETFDHAKVTLGGSGDEIYAYETLTLGSGLSIAQSAAGASDSLTGATIISFANITLSANGGAFTISPGSFTNNGVIGVTNGDTLTLQGGTFANAGQLLATGATIVFNEAATNTGTVEVGNSTVDLSYDSSMNTAFFELFAGQSDAMTIGYDATLDNTGAVLTIGNGSGFSTITFEGTISGGTIVDGGSGFNLNGGTLSGVTYQGVLDLSAANASVYIENGLTLTGADGSGPGAVNLTGNNSSLIFIDSETFNNATVTLGGDNAGIDAFNTLTLGQNLSIIQSAAGASDTLGGADAAVVVNDGTITASADGGAFTVDAQIFTNNGEIIASNGDTFDVESDVDFTNAQDEALIGGTFEAEAGSTIAFESQIATDDATIILSGEGSMIESATTPIEATLTAIGAGGTLELLSGRSFDTSAVFGNAGLLQLGGGSFTAASLTDAAGSTLLGNGVVAAAVANSGTIHAANGTLILQDGVSGEGGFQIDKGATLEFAGAITDTGTISFNGTGGTLALTTTSGFKNTILNFAAGDSIDLLKIVATSAVLNGSDQLVITDMGTPVATLDLGGNFDKTSFSTVSDGNGGTLIETTGPLVTGPQTLTELSGLAVALTGYQAYDADPAAQSNFTVTVSDKTGLLSATAEDGGTMAGAGTTKLTLTGTVAAVQAELATLAYTGGATGIKPTLTDTLTLTARGSKGGSDSLTTTITVDHLPPVTTVPATETVASGKTTAITGISIADADPTAGTATFTVKLTDKTGVLSALATTGGTVSGSDTKSLTLSGSLAAVNKELSGLTYKGSLTRNELVGGDTLTVTTSDGHGDSNAQTIAVTITRTGAAAPAVFPTASPSLDLFGQYVAAGFAAHRAGIGAIPAYLAPDARHLELTASHR